MITSNSPWRSLGDMSFEQWLEATDGAPAVIRVPLTYNSAKPHSILTYCMMVVESELFMKFNRNKRENNNPLNLRPPVGGGYLSFATPANGVKAYVERITSIDYKNGIYRDTTTILELIRVFAPKTDNNDPEAYAADVARLANQFVKEEPMPVLGKTPYPAIVERPLPDKFGSGMSWLPRWRADGTAVATWWHTMIGWLWSTDAYFRIPGVQAATDYGIGGAGDGASDGVIFRWINYFERRFTSGWASGWSGSPDFDEQGAAFFAKFGGAGVNPLGRSIEYSGLVATPMTIKQWASGIHLTAAIHHHELGQSAAEFQWNMHHREVAEKDCPFPRIYRFTSEYQRGIKLIMQHYETGIDIPEWVMIAGLKVPLAGGMDAPGPITPAPEKPIMIAFPERNGRTFHAAKNAKSRQWATTTSQLVKEYPEDTRLRIVGYYLGEEISGNDKWFVIKSSGPSNNARIHANGLKDEYIDPGLPHV